MIVQNTGNFIRHIGEVRLIPGASKLDASEELRFKKALEEPLNKALEKNGEIVVKTEGTKNIADLNAEDARKLIEDTFDLKLLDSFLEDEENGKNRKTVVEAIRKQADDILNPPEDNVVNKDNG